MAIAPVCMALITDFFHWIFIVGGGGGGFPVVYGIVSDANNVVSLQTRLPNVRSDSVIHSNTQRAFEMAGTCPAPRGRRRTIGTVSHFHILYKPVKIYVGQCSLPSVIQCKQLHSVLFLSMYFVSCHMLTHALLLGDYSKDCKGTVSQEIVYFYEPRHCATSRLVVGSIPDGVIGILHSNNPFGHVYETGIDSASNINEYQEYFWGVKAAGS